MNTDSTALEKIAVKDHSEPALFALMLDSSSYSSKPAASRAMPGISKRLETAEASVTLAELAQRVGARGQSFVPALMKGGRKAENWVSQQIFALDFDHGVTLADFQRTCAEWGVLPAFVYATFSHTPAQHRFRAVFALDQPVRDYSVRKALMGVLLKIFPECDTACKDASRLFLGGRQLLEQHLEERLNPVDLWELYFAKLKERDPSHFKRNAQRFCAGLGVDASAGFFGMERMEQGSMGKVGEKTVGVISLIAHTEKSPILSRAGECYALRFQANAGKQKTANTATPQQARSLPQPARQRPRFTDEDKQTLLDNCLLLREYFSGVRHVHYAERRLLLYNLYQRENGIAWYKEGLASRDDYQDDYQLITGARKYDSRPEGCANCPYADECDHRKNLLQQIPCKRRECRPLLASPPACDPVEKTRLKLATALQEALLSDDTKVHVIRCDTGVGKTQALLESKLLDNVCIAFPTHRLSREAYDRLGDHTAFLWPERPTLPESLAIQLERIDRMHVGSPYKVFLRALNDEDVRDCDQWAERIRQYLEANQALESETLIFTTHEKAFQVKNPEVHTFVFDEDPLKSVLQMTDLALADIESFLRVVQSQSAPEAKPIEEHLKRVLDAVRKKSVTQNTTPAYSRDHLRDLLVRMPSSFACPIEALFTCCAYALGGRGDTIHCIVRREIPDRKCIVLSATADEALYRALLGERLRFVDLGSTAMKGRLVCHRKKGYSKSTIKANIGAFATEVMAEMGKHGFEGIITHKFLAEDGPDGLRLKGTKGKVPVLATFGGLSGLDSFGGRNIAVFGTPHIDAVCYRLYAQALGLAATEGAWHFEERTVERNGFEFSIMTCSDDPALAGLQLSLIEGELLQAVGRARLVNHDCTVRLYSNLPLRGAELV